MAGYGEGPEYAAEVVKRIPGIGTQVATKSPVAAPKSILAMPDDQMPNLSSLPMAQAPVAAQPVRVAAAQVPVQAPLQASPAIGASATMPQQVAAAAMVPQNNPWTGLGSLMPEQAMRPADIDFGNAGQQQAAMAEEEFVKAQADNAQRTQAMLKQFGLGRYSQGLERYEATVPEFTRPA